MIERSALLEGFTERLRHAWQKLRDEDRARLLAPCAAELQREFQAAQKSADGAIDELARYLCDAFDRPA